MDPAERPGSSGARGGGGEGRGGGVWQAAPSRSCVNHRPQIETAHAYLGHINTTQSYGKPKPS